MSRQVPRIAQLMAQWASRDFATAARGKERKVAVLGAAGGIGQPLSMLMKVGVVVVCREQERTDRCEHA